jgi:hypothetical protein
LRSTADDAAFKIPPTPFAKGGEGGFHSAEDGAVRRVLLSMNRRWVAGLIVAGVGAAAFLLWPIIPVLEIVDAGSGRIVFCARVRQGEEFGLSFVHSVNRRPVYDTLRVENDHLVIVKSRFDSFGAGMPESSTAEGTLAVAPDGWLEWTVNRPVPELTLRVGRVADHTLRLQDRQIHLADLAQGGAPLTIRVRKARTVDLMKGRTMP